MNEQLNTAGGTVIGLALGTSGRDGRRVAATGPTIGWLTDTMVLPSGLPLPAVHSADPRLTPGLIFLLGKTLTGPGVTGPTALAAVDRVYAGAEIIDSRRGDWRSTAPVAVTDGTPPAHFLIGPVSHRPEDLDLSLEACLLEVNGEVFDSATGVAAHGHPAEALALAANTLAQQNITLQPGWLVFTGGLTSAATITSETTVAASFTHLGSITLPRG